MSEQTVEDMEATAPEIEADGEEPSSPVASEVTDAKIPTIVRTRGAIVSNLRAAFEQQASGGPRARPVSADSRGITGNGRLSTFDADFARLKDAMAQEQSAREADKQRLKEQETEIEQLKVQIEELEAGNADKMETDEVDEPDQGNEELLSTLHSARAQCQASEAEASALRAQLAELKKSISTNTRIESHEMTDSAFQGEFGTLCYQLQDWAINRFRKIKIADGAEELVAKLGSMPELPAHERVTDLLKHWDPSVKMAMLQSATMTLLMPIFEDAMPFGLPPRAEWSEAIRAASHGLSELLDASAYNRWRATTFDIICHSEAMSPFVHSAANKVASEICSVLDLITSSTTSEAQTDALRNVIRRVIALSHSLRVQRAIYDVLLPQPGESFDVDSMEDTMDDFDGPEHSTIRCALFPSVLKPSMSGTASVIFKARVS